MAYLGGWDKGDKCPREPGWGVSPSPPLQDPPTPPMQRLSKAGVGVTDAQQPHRRCSPRMLPQSITHSSVWSTSSWLCNYNYALRMRSDPAAAGDGGARNQEVVQTRHGL